MAERAHLLGVLLATSLVVCSARALAAPPPEPPAAQEHDSAFRSGLEQYGHGNYVTAIATWESLLNTMGEERGYKVLYNLGLAYQAIGDVTRAIERYRAFGKQVAARPNAGEDLVARAEDANKRASQLETTHGAVHVLPPKRGGLVLTRVGTSEPRAAGYVVWLAPGAHTIELFVGTDHAKTMTIQVEPARSVDIDTSAPEAPPAEPPRAPPERPRSSEPSSPSNTWIYVGAAATVVSLALPATLYIVANGKKQDADALGPGHSAYADARSTYLSWRTGYYVSYALPAALAATTIALVVFRPSPSTRVGVSPTGAAVTGTF